MADAEPTPPAALPAAITSSLATVWKRYASARPADASTEVEGNIVRCVLRDAVGSFDQGLSEHDGGTENSPRTVTTYRREATAAVAGASGRRVLAFISEHDAASDVATEVFVLDAAPAAAKLGAERWIAN